MRFVSYSKYVGCVVSAKSVERIARKGMNTGCGIPKIKSVFGELFYNIAVIFKPSFEVITHT